MFNFGSPEQLYAMIVDRANAEDGPGAPDLPVDEMSVRQLKDAVAYAMICWKIAAKEDADQAVLDLGKKYFDEAWCALIDSDDEFKKRFIEMGLLVPSANRKPYEDYAKGLISEL